MKLSELFETNLIADDDKVILRFVTAPCIEEVRTGEWYCDRILEKHESGILSINYDAICKEWRITLEPEATT